MVLSGHYTCVYLKHLAILTITCILYSPWHQFYGSDSLSAYQLAHGSTMPICEKLILFLDDLIQSQQLFDAKCKLTKFLKSKSENLVPSERNLLAVYILDGEQKRDKWSSLRTRTKCQRYMGTRTVVLTACRAIKPDL